jgi:hypothetical protein
MLIEDTPNVPYVFHAYCIGKVSRVDFVPINKKPGFQDETEETGNVISAFVHFTELYNTPITLAILNELENERSYNLHLNEICQRNSYWILLKSKNPIPETMMNNAQIVDNCRFLEKKIDSLMDIVNKQEERIRQLEEHIQTLSDGKS